MKTRTVCTISSDYYQDGPGPLAYGTLSGEEIVLTDRFVSIYMDLEAARRLYDSLGRFFKKPSRSKPRKKAA